MHRHRVNASSLLLFPGTAKGLDGSAGSWRRALHLNAHSRCVWRAWGQITGRTESLKSIKMMSPIGSGGHGHCRARTACPEPSSVPSPAKPAGAAAGAEERLSSLSHTIWGSWLNAPTLGSAVNNSPSRAVGGIRFRRGREDGNKQLFKYTSPPVCRRNVWEQL